MRILIVEDEVRLAETLRDLLELEHYTADISHDGESGLDNALSDIYDLVILDVMLPKKDGFSVLRELRQAGKTMPVLMLSARSELSDRVEGLDCGADYYLTKPFEPKELLACVRMLTRRQPEQRASNDLEYGDLHLETDTLHQLIVDVQAGVERCIYVFQTTLIPFVDDIIEVTGRTIVVLVIVKTAVFIVGRNNTVHLCGIGIRIHTIETIGVRFGGIHGEIYIEFLGKCHVQSDV